MYALPADPTSDPKSINLFQRLLNDAHGAGLTADGVWGPATSAAVAAVVGGDGDSLNPFQAKEFIKSLHFAWGPEILHGNDSHSTDYAAADHNHGGAGHNHDTKYAKADHVHDEGVTGPPQ